MTSVRSNAARVSADLGEYIRETGIEESAGVRMASKGVTTVLLKITPPFQTLSPSENFATQKRIGEFAVKRDLNRSFKTINDLQVLTNPKKPLVFKKLQEAVVRRDVSQLVVMLEKLNYVGITADRIYDRADVGLHDGLRKHGRVPKGARSYFIFDRDSRDDLEEQLLDALGRGKSGWLGAADALGISAPGWITRHGSNGRAGDSSSAQVDPSFLGINNVTYLGDFAGEYRIVEMALDREAGNLERQIVAKRAGLWNKKS